MQETRMLMMLREFRDEVAHKRNYEDRTLWTRNWQIDGDTRFILKAETLYDLGEAIVEFELVEVTFAGDLSTSAHHVHITMATQQQMIAFLDQQINLLTSGYVPKPQVPDNYGAW